MQNSLNVLNRLPRFNDRERKHYAAKLEDAQECFIQAVIGGADSDLLLPIMTEILWYGGHIDVALRAAAEQHEADARQELDPIDKKYSCRIAEIYRNTADQLSAAWDEFESANKAADAADPIASTDPQTIQRQPS